VGGFSDEAEKKGQKMVVGRKGTVTVFPITDRYKVLRWSQGTGYW